MKEIESIIFFFLVFTCKTDADCYGNGYCHARECKCSANYEYAQDCSHHGCKYIKLVNLCVSLYTNSLVKATFGPEKKRSQPNFTLSIT